MLVVLVDQRQERLPPAVRARRIGNVFQQRYQIQRSVDVLWKAAAVFVNVAVISFSLITLIIPFKGGQVRRRRRRRRLRPMRGSSLQVTTDDEPIARR